MTRGKRSITKEDEARYHKEYQRKRNHNDPEYHAKQLANCNWIKRYENKEYGRSDIQ